MSYVSDSLMPGETVVFASRLHPIIFWPVAVWGSLALFSIGHSDAVAGFLLLAALAGISPLVRYLTSEFAVTSKRVIVKDGFIRRRSLELNLAKVESVAVNQSITGRMFGYGTLRVRGTGSTNERFRGISKAMEFRRELQQIAA